VVLALAFSVAAEASAAETPADVETDHVDAAGDGSPRSASVLVHASTLVTGSAGIEAAVALGAIAALSVEGDWRPVAAPRVFAAVVGVVIYPERSTFHALYVHPRFAWAWASGLAVADGAVLLGYQWTWAPGATIRLAGGVGYSNTTRGDADGSPAQLGLHPELDAAAGWVF
jgi:hypothetical protein